MQFLTQSILLFLATAVIAKNIILSNDDGWQATNIRATYYKLKEAGHEVWLVAPVSQRSGFGGKFDIPTSPTLQTDGEFKYPPAGSPSWGHEEEDDHIWYFNGTPASSIAFGLQYVIPEKFNNASIDLVVAGPNEGTNLSPGMFTLSGTVGATYNSVYRGYPAVAFSGSNSNNSFFKDSLDLNDTSEPSTIYANKVTEFVDQIFKAQGDNSRALPLGVGLNVNFPKVGYENESCTDPAWVFTRLTGQYASGADLKYNASSNSFEWAQTSWQALTVCNNGDCSLPSENLIVEHTKCATSVSVFAIDYDANLGITNQVEGLLDPLFKKN
ncbi:Pho100 inducible acid phosphatase [Candida orthopsilosis Co 90-125]|uniref:Pho100 inducible acid phosphatase n=1 Tax=Candida orthopsilosis (strain 90-125) TaxID=1136231 RepID=H8WX27_CANO9|nr:Pho100 inducible acid phosphatase [Candida orthopsilosis Co 90-125]CCG21167.1 Pho100 inducible acid phosphatase [Candida orthopsilosis Co 90-125]